MQVQSLTLPDVALPQGDKDALTYDEPEWIVRAADEHGYVWARRAQAMREPRSRRLV